jgi:hypothetical protein
MTKKNQILIVCSLSVMLLFNGCSRLSSPQPVPLIKPTLILPIETSTHITSSPIATQTSVLIQTPTSIPQINTPIEPTVSPQPTLSHENAWALINDLMLKNGGCDLPCWWGLFPGKSKVQDVNSFLSTFNGIAVLNNLSADPQYISLTVPINKVNLDIAINAWEHNNIVDRLFVSLQSNKHGDYGWEAYYGDPNYNQVTRKFQLSEILTNYGLPSKVLIAPGPFDGFVILLAYMKEGFLISYESPGKKAEGNYVGCPSESQISVWLWSPTENLTLKEVVSNTPFGDVDATTIDYFKPIDETTKMSMDEFYKIYKNPENHLCVETPSAFWPSPN